MPEEEGHFGVHIKTKTTLVFTARQQRVLHTNSSTFITIMSAWGWFVCVFAAVERVPRVSPAESPSTPVALYSEGRVRSSPNLGTQVTPLPSPAANSEAGEFSFQTLCLGSRGGRGCQVTPLNVWIRKKCERAIPWAVTTPLSNASHPIYREARGQLSVDATPQAAPFPSLPAFIWLTLSRKCKYPA